MAAGNFKWFLHAPYLATKGDLDMDGQIRAVLVTSSWTPAQTTDDAWSDISANEVANGNGYATHGKLVTQGITKVGSEVRFDINDQIWTSSTITAKYMVLVRDANDDGTLAAGDIPIGYVDLDTGGGSVSSTSADFSVAIHTDGALKITVS